MAMSSRPALGLALLTATGLSLAQGLDGSWSTRIESSGEEVRYEVNLAHSQTRLVGTWSVDTFRSSAGCLLGGTGSNDASFRTCTTDGSAGSRYLNEVCPTYHPDQNRFVPKGSKLAWETWDPQRNAWRLFVLLERSKATQSLAWDQDECGKP